MRASARGPGAPPRPVGARAAGRRRRAGQTAVEYMLTTVTLVMVFSSMYGFLQGQTKKLFEAAGMKILTSYHIR